MLPNSVPGKMPLHIPSMMQKSQSFGARPPPPNNPGAGNGNRYADRFNPFYRLGKGLYKQCRSDEMAHKKPSHMDVHGLPFLFCHYTSWHFVFHFYTQPLLLPRHTIVAGYYGISSSVCPSIRPSVPTLFPDISPATVFIRMH